MPKSVCILESLSIEWDSEVTLGMSLDLYIYGLAARGLGLA